MSTCIGFPQSKNLISRRMKITCPYCWQSIDIEYLTTSTEPVELVTDCEVCCRPIKIIARRKPDGEDPSIEIEAES
tara:strand:+ start:1964 stop:2191 length:228 start_codon:yes stop_codon:yes gene_type:complete